ncbi:MAG: helix-turn-helix domain-containing protein [Bacteroidota bacterium]
MQEISLNIIDLFILFGTFQGFILAIVLLTTKRMRRTSNLFLALLLFVFSVLNLDTIIHSSLYEVYPISIYLPIYFFTLIPVSLYFFITYLTQPNYKFQRKDILLFILPAIEASYQLASFLHKLWTGNFGYDLYERYRVVISVFEVIGIMGVFYFLPTSIKRLNQYQKLLYDNYAEVEEKNLNWLRVTLIGGAGIATIWFLVVLLRYTSTQDQLLLARAVWLGLTIMICWIGYSMLIRQGLLDSSIFGILDEQEKEEKKLELSSKTDAHYQKILELLEQEKIYRNSNLNLSILAENTGLSRGYVSQIINQKRKQNFFEFINYFRVEEVKKEMLNPDMQHLSILGIAQNAGFKSKSTFNAVFKKITKMTPSEYRKKQA